MFYHNFPVKFVATFLLVVPLTLCQTPSLLVDMGLVTPTPTPDPFAPYRSILQPWANDHLDPTLPQYHLTARLDDAQTTISGIGRLTLPAAGSEIVFRLYPNFEHYAGSIRVTQAQINGRSVDIDSLAENSAISLIPPAVATDSVSQTVTIDLAFTTQLGRKDEAVDNYTLFGWDGSILSLPGFYPVLAVYEGRDWVLDIPPLHSDVLYNEVALYQLDLTLPGDLIAVSSGVTLNVIDNPDQTRTWQIFGGPLRDMTVIAGPFQAVSDSAAGATVTSYYLPGHKEAALTALSHATASLRYYSEMYGPYPYIELDIIEAPLNVRGMEYSGLALIGRKLYRTPSDDLAFLVAHEVGHQWWYAVVGNDPYQHPWLDEGLTEYGAFDYYRTVFGEDEAEQQLVGGWQLPFEAAAQGNIDGVVARPAANFDPIKYQLLVYTKAALFFNALHSELGDEVYRQVLQSYYAENRYEIASPQTFLATAERVSGRNLNPLANQWLR